MSIAVVLVSGGLDSCVAAAVAATESELALLHVSYHQLTEGREFRAYSAIADHYRVSKRLHVNLEHISTMGGTGLVQGASTAPSLVDAGLPTTYVPFRNANLLSISVAWAETLGASSVYIGAHEVQSPYPDCTRSFFEAFNQMTAAGTAAKSSITVKTPLIAMNKAQIILRGIELNAPLELTWSCYTETEVACGKCDSCLLRSQGFRKAGMIDPLAAGD